MAYQNIDFDLILNLLSVRISVTSLFQLRVDIPKKDRDHTYPIMVRDDIPEVNETMTGVNSADFMVILGDLKTYTLHWTNFVPETFSVYSDGLEK